MLRLYLVLVLALACACPAQGWSLWPFSSEETTASDTESGAYLAKSPVPFEMTGAEEKFLAEAKKYMGDLRPLDSCHQIVINRIRKSCGDINEEELGKLGVQLLNCQSLAENRKTYECTDEMRLADCTSSMDVATWNSYHIISNRARSVCYATRQQQFRLKTEYTVNQLGKQAGEQLRLMDTLHSGQTVLANLASETVDKVTAGQEKLIDQQRRLQVSHQSTQRSVSNGLRSNIEALTQEKRLINEGREHLTDMTEKINKKLESATKEMKKQEVDRKESHGEILHDLSDIRGKAQDVWDKIDESTSQMLQFHENSAEHYTNTMKNLEKMNDTINFLLQAIESMQSNLDSRITWLADQFGGTGNKLATLVTCLMHVGYFFAATFSILFLQAPMFTRLVLLIMVPVNAWCEIRRGSSLTFASLTALLLTVLFGNWLYFYFKRRFSNNAQWKIEQAHSVFALQGPGNDSPCKSTCSGTTCGPFSSTLNSTRISPNTSNWSPTAQSRRQLDMSSVSSRTSTPRRGTPRKRCHGLTKAGGKCKRAASESGFCSTHAH